MIALPWEGVVLSALALDPSGTAKNNDITDAFDDGVMVLGIAQTAIPPFGLRGTQRAGVMWSDKTRLSLDQDPGNIARLLLTERFPRLGNPGPVLRRLLERFFPQLLVPTQRANREDSTWAMFYGFDQYLWHPGGDKTRGIGLFFTFGAADGGTNPIKYSCAMGISGKGVVPGREREDAVEIFYNASLTPWLNVTADLQIIEPALTKTLGSSGLKDVDTAVVAALRMQIRL